MNYTITTKHDGFTREYFAETYLNASVLYNVLTQHYPFVELRDYQRVIFTYDPEAQYMD